MQIDSLLDLELESNIYSFDLIRISDTKNSSFDKNIGATICNILNEFFIKNPNGIIHYICDDADSKAIKRELTFKKWFKTFNLDPLKTHISANLKGTIYLGAVLLNSNPEKEKIYSHFYEDLEQYELNNDKVGSITMI